MSWTTPEAPFGASPSRGRHPWPGKASSTVALEDDAACLAVSGAGK